MSTASDHVDRYATLIFMLTDGSLISFVAVTDIDRAMHFYSDGLGLTVKACGDDWCVMDANGTSLRLTLVDSKPDLDYTVVGWSVTDIAITVSDLADRGVSFQRYPGFEQDGLGIWKSAKGDRVAWFKDPDENVLSVTQFAD